MDRDVLPGRDYWYRLDATTRDGEALHFGPIAGTAVKVTEFAFGALVPNPTRGPLGLSFALPAEARATVRVLDVQGRSVVTLVDGVLTAGVHRLAWNGESDNGALSPGVYFAAAELGGRRFVKRFVIAR
jgi:hypothetical protein